MISLPSWQTTSWQVVGSTQDQQPLLTPGTVPAGQLVGGGKAQIGSLGSVPPQTGGGGSSPQVRASTQAQQPLRAAAT